MQLPESFKLDLKLMEQCCTCPSFWDQVQEHHLELGDLFDSAGQTGKDRLLTHFGDEGKKDNMTYATIGNELLGMLATEWVESRWPHLPLRFVSQIFVICLFD